MAKLSAKQLETLRTAKAAVDAWNLRYDVGLAVDYQRHPEAPTVGRKTRSLAFVVDNCRPCIVLHREQGIVDLHRCRPIEGSAVDELAALTGEPTHPKHVHRRRLLGRVESVSREIDLIKYRLARAYEALNEDSPIEFSIDVKQIGRDLEGLGQTCLNLHLSADPKSIDDELNPREQG